MPLPQELQDALDRLEALATDYRDKFTTRAALDAAREEAIQSAAVAKAAEDQAAQVEGEQLTSTLALMKQIYSLK